MKKIITAVITMGVLLGCGKQDQATLNEDEANLVEGVVEKNTPLEAKPNVVIFYVDDLGFGDLSSYGAQGVSTPNVDALASAGIRYTDAHSPAATCTPSRYSMLTGRYAFRNNAAVLPGDAPLIIAPESYTLMDMFKDAGYTTSVIGKWHLGLGDGQVDWNADVKPGPLELGFDYSFLIPATGDRVPTVYLENHKVVGLSSNEPLSVSYKKEKIGTRPDGRENKDVLKQIADDQHADSVINGISRIGWMKGGQSAEWVDEEFADVFTEKAKHFIKENKNKPFFLYFPFHDIHVPRMPHPRFVGQSKMGPRGDAIVQMDWMTGQIVDELKAQGVFENTLIVFSSDNGPVLNDGYEDQAIELLGNHKPGGPYRGGKYSAYEAGTRVPMIVTYPNGITKQGESSALVSHIDLFRSFAALVGVTLPEESAPDSENILPAFLSAESEGRTVMLEESLTMSLRKGNFKYIQPVPQGEPEWIIKKGIEAGFSNTDQLYDLSTDEGEKKNIAAKHPALVEEMKQQLHAILGTEQAL